MVKKHSQIKNKEQQKFVVSKRLSIFNYQFPLIIFIFALLLYSNTLHHGYVMDDGVVITNNQFVMEGVSGIPKILSTEMWHFQNINLGYYRPLAQITFAIENEFFPGNPQVSHLDNILLYGLTGFFLCILLMNLFKNSHPMLSFIATLLFIAHPVHTEVVANIKSRDEMLAFLNLVIALLFFLRAYKNGKLDLRFLLFSCLFFYLALLSKETSMTGFLLAPLILYFSGKESIKKNLLRAVPFLGVILLFQIQKYVMIGTFSRVVSEDILNFPYAAANAQFPSAFLIFLWCIKLILLPHPLSYDYAYNQIPAAQFSSPAVWFGIMLFIAFLVFSFIGLKKKSPAVFGVSFLCITLIPALAFVFLRGGIFAERILYAPALGFSMVLAFLFLKITKAEAGFKSLVLSPKSIPLHIILVLFSIKTYSRNKDWKDNLTLFAKGAETCPDSYHTNVTYAWESVLAGEAEQNPEKKKEYMTNAITYYQKGLAIYDKVAADWYNLGVSYSHLGKIDETVKAYEHTIALNPKHLNSCYNLASIYLGKKDSPNSLKYFLMAYQSDSAFMDVSFKIGLNYQIMGNPKSAIPYYESYFRKNPNDRNVITNLLIAYKALNNTEKINYFMSLPVK
ncbi:MAG: hypothetical protein EPN85_12080 [Bacteroidetes bacterium]|nr:MAG: hypothetical protein EPN85_12080 [Bacteroidota bacterium]